MAELLERQLERLTAAQTLAHGANGAAACAMLEGSHPLGSSQLDTFLYAEQQKIAEKRPLELFPPLFNVSVRAV